MTNILFLHPNFPAQFRLIAREIATREDCRVVAVGHGPRSAQELGQIAYEHYDKLSGPGEIVFPPIQSLAENVRRGRTVRDILEGLRSRGFLPDCVVAHPGWGDAMFVRDVFPNARFIAYLEFYYRGENSDVDFDPEFEVAPVDLPFTRLRNTVNLFAFAESDQSITPTEWQASLFPASIRNQLSVLHDGIDCDAVAPRSSVFQLPDGTQLSKDDEIITYVARSLEPYRGFHTFMRSLPALLRSRPKARIVVVGGGEGVSYGRAPRGGTSWKAVMLQELEGALDLARVHFVNRIPYSQYLALLNVSTVHVYLTYPFVMSWSLLEAMASQCTIVGSRTGPVTEVVLDRQNGRLVDFFTPDELTDVVAELLADPDQRRQLGAAARSTVVDRYDFRSRILPQYLRLLGLE